MTTEGDNSCINIVLLFKFGHTFLGFFFYYAASYTLCILYIHVGYMYSLCPIDSCLFNFFPTYFFFLCFPILLLRLHTESFTSVTILVLTFQFDSLLSSLFIC